MTSTMRDLTPEQRQLLADGWVGFLRTERGQRYAELTAKVVPDERYDMAIQQNMAGEFLAELATNAGWEASGESDVAGGQIMVRNPARAERDAVRRAVVYKEANSLYHYSKQLAIEADTDAIVPRALCVPENGHNFFLEDEYQPANDQVKGWIRRYRAGATKRGLLWLGLQGSGKSTMEAELARALLRSRVSVGWVDVHDLLYNVADSHNGAVEADLLGHYSEVQVLAINDLGSEKPSDSMGRFITRLLEQAAHQEQPVLVSTNLTLAQLKEHYGHDGYGRETYDVAERLLSRLVGVTELVTGWPVRDLRAV